MGKAAEYDGGMPHVAMADPHESNAKPARVKARPRDRVLAEAVRILEERQSRPLEDSAIVAAVISECEGRDLEPRIIERATRLAPAQHLDEATDQAAAGVRLAVLAAVVGAMVLGALAARAALRDGTASVAGLLFGLLGIQTLLLIIWLIWFPLRDRLGGGSMLGRAVMALGRFIARRLAPRKERGRMSAAVTALGVVHARGRTGAWTLSAIAHSVWAAFNLGAMIVLAALFLGEGYQFRWDSTWLSAETYRGMIETIATLPQRAGFQAPDAAQIESSRAPRGMVVLTSQDVATREAWSWLFFGALAVYGLAPRAVLLALSLLLRHRGLARGGLDLSRPGFAMLRARLLPDADIARSARDARIEEVHLPREAHAPPPRVPGRPAIVGVELSKPASGWPPRLPAPVADLGIVDGRDDAHRVLHNLSHAATSPAPLVIVAELKRAPDRGIERLIADLARAAGGETWLILAGGRDIGRTSAADVVARRSDDWRALASRAGIPAERTIEIDLDHLTDETRPRFHRIVSGHGAADRPTSRPRRLEEAFRAIQQRAGSWGEPPSDAEIGALHVDISRIYGHEARIWGARFATQIIGGLKDGGRALSIDAALPALRGAAESIRSLLPHALAGRAKWMAAGGLAGALGCIAVAITMTPAAAAALPMWSLVGAAISAVIAPAKSPSAGVTNAQPPTRAIDDALRSAVLFALVLELQGRAEATITRILERTLGALPDDVIAISSLPSWLDDIRHRFDLALIEEEKRP